MIKIVADNFVKTEERNLFLEKAAALILKTREEKGNISYVLHEDVNDPCHLTFIEEWNDEESIKRHNASEHFTKLVPEMAECCYKEGTCVLYKEI